MQEESQILIEGARVHNLKNISIQIPRNKFVVITGLSGSGKSSLAFDTLFAEGQRRYVESLSSYARQFLGRIEKPDVDKILGIPPAIAIEQKVSTRNPRSTVGTSTEIYDYLKLLFSRIGKTYSPVSGELVKRHSVSDVVNAVLRYGSEVNILILAPLAPKKGRSPEEQLQILLKQGFSRILSNEEVIKIDDILETGKLPKKTDDAFLLIDRLTGSDDEDNRGRIADSVQTAFFEGEGICFIKEFKEDSEAISFSNRFEADGIQFEQPNINLFSFNNPVGACPKCEGFGMTIGIDEDLVIPNKSLSIYEDAIVCWKGEKMSKWKEKLILNASKFNFPIHKPVYELSSEQRELLWSGNQYFKGLDSFFKHLEEKAYKIQYRVMLSRYRGKTTCPLCKGKRLKQEASYVRIDHKTITDLVDLPIEQLHKFFLNLQLSEHEQEIADRLLKEICNRIGFLKNVGLGYLTLNRLSSTLSGGESQRINLAGSLGSNLVGSLYILDEPSIGLHSRDTHLLIKVLKELQSLGNTVLVVEHDEEIIKAADQIIDMGPKAGRLGGELVFQGPLNKLLSDSNCITAQYLNGKKCIPVPGSPRKWNNYIEVSGCLQNNLKNIDVKFPLNIITVVTGVSGSGKSSLVNEVLFNALNKKLTGTAGKAIQYKALGGDLHLISNVQYVDQNPIGKSSRSNPVTYIKAWDEIRKLFAAQKISEFNGFRPGHFSFNTEGGRCEECQGDGFIKIEMQFMADVSLVCESCKGKRFKDEVLEVKYQDKNVYDVLEMTVNEAMEFFSIENGSYEKKILKKLKPLQEVGLGYVKLGQSSNTLSGGESQRVKLASFLAQEKTNEHNLFIFDEPTTGLHFDDINILLTAFNKLIKKGNTIIIIEHNMDVIKAADWIIDLGPEGGEKGGNIVYEGVPAGICKKEESYTGKYLKEKIS